MLWLFTRVAGCRMGTSEANHSLGRAYPANFFMATLSRALNRIRPISIKWATKCAIK